MLSRWAEHNRRTAERRLARWQGLAVLFVLAALCAFLSGCLTPAKLAEMAQRAAQTIFDGAQWMRDEDPADPFAEPPPSYSQDNDLP